MSDAIRVVVVDDMEETRANIGRLITFVDGVVLAGQASDGLEALQVCRTAKPNCVLMDVNMPRMGGLEAAAAIRRELPDITVLMMSVDDSPTYRRQALAVGAAGFLLKPLSIDSLTKTLSHVRQARVSV